MAWAGWFGQEKKTRQLNIYQSVATHQKHKNSRENNSKFSFTYAISTPISTSQISTRFDHIEIYPYPISVLNTLHVTYSFQSSLFYYPCCDVKKRISAVPFTGKSEQNCGIHAKKDEVRLSDILVLFVVLCTLVKIGAVHSG